MKIVAKRGDNSYLVDLGDEQARVLDTDQGKFFPPFYIHSILARGYWEPYEPKDGELEDLLDQIDETEGDRAPKRKRAVTFGPALEAVHASTNQISFPGAEPGTWMRADYRVVKAEAGGTAERQYTLGVSYPAVEVDAHGDFATAEEVENAAWSYLAQGAGVGLMHKNGTDGAGKAVESYIWRGPDWTVNGQTIQAGDWLLGVVWDDAAWAAIKRGELTGYSIQGTARRSE